MTRLWLKAVAATSAMLLAFPAGAASLPPYKDALFAYGETTAALDGGHYLDVPYSEKRDIDERDEIPERRAHRRYVDLSVVGQDRDVHVQTGSGESVRTRQVGTQQRPSPIVLFVHGKGGTADLGMNDWSFGGNFNRLKNLVVRGGGLYVTIDAGALDEAAADRVADVVTTLGETGAPVVLACGSMGGAVCWNLSARPGVATRLAGLVLLGVSTSSTALAQVASGRGGRALPLLIAHGSRDRVYPVETQRQAFAAARRLDPARPLRMVVFDGGTHGTPIRMVDWRDTLNWMLDG